MSNIIVNKKLYLSAKKLAPLGLYAKSFIPIIISGNAFELRYFTDRGHGTDVEFGIYLKDRKYARIGFIVWHNGSIEEDKGFIQESDKDSNEPTIKLTVNELIPICLAVINNKIST